MLRRHRIKIVREVRSQIFRQIAKKTKGLPVVCQGFLAKMTGNMQADRVQRRQPVFVRWCLQYGAFFKENFDFKSLNF